MTLRLKIEILNMLHTLHIIVYNEECRRLCVSKCIPDNILGEFLLGTCLHIWTVSSMVSGSLVFNVSGSSNINRAPNTARTPMMIEGKGCQVFC